MWSGLKVVSQLYLRPRAPLRCVIVSSGNDECVGLNPTARCAACRVARPEGRSRSVGAVRHSVLLFLLMSCGLCMLCRVPICARARFHGHIILKIDNDILDLTADPRGPAVPLRKRSIIGHCD